MLDSGYEVVSLRNQRASDTPTRSELTAVFAVLCFAAVWLFSPIASSGVWDPHEVDTADIARRVAVHAWGRAELARAGDPASIPTLSDLGTGELGITSIGASFSLFGVHDWSGRLPLALWGWIAAASLFILIWRTFDLRAAAVSVMVLLSLPVFFLQARTMIGDIVPMAAVSATAAGATLICVESRVGPRSAGWAMLLLGALAGYLSRGLLVVALPLLSVGLPALLQRSAAGNVRRPWPALGLVAFGLVALGAFVSLALLTLGSTSTLRAAGMPFVDPDPDSSTFDRVFRHLGHGLFPLSALLPVAFASLAKVDEADPRRALGKAVLLAGSSFGLVASVLLTPLAGNLPFFGVGFLAGVLGVHLDGLRRAQLSRLSLIISVLALGVLHVDIQRSPVRLLEGFALPGLELDPTFLGHTGLSRSTLLLLAALLLSTVTPSSELAGSAGFTRYLAAKREALRSAGAQLYAAAQGNIVFALVLIEAALVGMAAMLAVGVRAGWAPLANVPAWLGEAGVAAWWFLPLTAFLAVTFVSLLRDLLGWLSRRWAFSSSTLMSLGIVGSGATLAFDYFPASFDHASPKGAFEAYKQLRAQGDEVAVTGTSTALASFYINEEVANFEAMPAAFNFLDKSELAQGRRFLVLKRSELPLFNHLWRSEHRVNVPVVMEQSAMLLLASSAESSSNPLNSVLSSESPTMAHSSSAVFDDSLELLGWEIRTAAGKQVEVLLPGEDYSFRSAFRVRRRISVEWTSFLHIEKDRQRINADHEPVAGLYPMKLWLAGDVLIDEHPFRLPPNWSPGTCRLLAGFFVGGERIQVTEGHARDNRVELGTVVIR